MTPVVDYLIPRPDVESSKIGAIGVSMGGWLVAQTAAFEHRITAALAVYGVYDVHEAYRNAMPSPMCAALDSGDRDLDKMGMWSFNVDSAAQWMDLTKKMKLKGLEDKIQCSIWGMGGRGRDRSILPRTAGKSTI
ncbi:hypothetical protein QQZ08_006102 [Neonectria magnoliae]|uniref:Peptidase S9 prolyl oligopeptidase catalytic domain-containing protein n=1 Tax=Neonectria magnoliae TaxID=2732573 RepID=A0ABR1I1D8_9HYPO